MCLVRFLSFLPPRNEFLLERGVIWLGHFVVPGFDLCGGDEFFQKIQCLGTFFLVTFHT